MAGAFCFAMHRPFRFLVFKWLCYSLNLKHWSQGWKELPLGGGTAVVLSDSLIVCMGGVDKDIFLQALRQPVPDYLLHEPEWYRLNKKLLVYHVLRREWQTAFCSSDLARAGATAVSSGNTIVCINGEVKPGVRTSCITLVEGE